MFDKNKETLYTVLKLVGHFDALKNWKGWPVGHFDILEIESITCRTLNFIRDCQLELVGHTSVLKMKGDNLSDS